MFQVQVELESLLARGGKLQGFSHSTVSGSRLELFSGDFPNWKLKRFFLVLNFHFLWLRFRGKGQNDLVLLCVQPVSFEPAFQDGKRDENSTENSAVNNNKKSKQEDDTLVRLSGKQKREKSEANRIHQNRVVLGAREKKREKREEDTGTKHNDVMVFHLFTRILFTILVCRAKLMKSRFEKYFFLCLRKIWWNSEVNSHWKTCRKMLRNLMKFLKIKWNRKLA